MDSITKKSFWLAFKILLTNFHAINRRYFGTVINIVEEVNKGLEKCKLLPEVTDHSGVIEKTLRDEEYLTKILNNFNGLSDLEGFVISFDILSKKTNESTVKAWVFADFQNSSFLLKFNCLKMDNFEVCLDSDGQCVCKTINPKNLIFSEIERWQKYVFLPKFLKWCRYQNSTDSKNTKIEHIKSLNLIDIVGYNELYKNLKKKYSQQVLKLWAAADERTDPLKYVYEELAIAAYLLMLWKNKNIVFNTPKGFIDLGCGNGLLVFILIQEGISGYGVDLRRRRIWSFYPEEVRTRLLEQPVNPLIFKVPNDVDWLIGNHSDELSAWIPILTTSQRYNLSFFLLPCCPFELSGQRFQRRNSSVSAYQDFCSYIEEIANMCGFSAEKDRLKIPSTKRIAIIGTQRTYQHKNYSKQLKKVEEFISGKLKEVNCVQLRNQKEVVRNCTQIAPEIIIKLIIKIFGFLVNNAVEDNPHNVAWNEGVTLTIAEIANLLDDSDRKYIKFEFGGLKTLLRNKHEIFEVTREDMVKIRKPKLFQVKQIELTWKKRKCFFKDYHPQGCPLKDQECSFIH